MNEIYSFYNGGCHNRKTHLKQKKIRKFYHLKKIIDIRWITSDYNSMKALHTMRDIVIRDLEDIEKDMHFSADTRIKAAKFREKLLGKQFLVLFNLFYGIVSELSVLSLDMQIRDALLVDASSFTTKCRGIFTNLKTVNAKNMELFSM